MDLLGSERLPAAHFKAIYSIILRKGSIPPSVSQYQHIDLTQQALKRTKFHDTREFATAIRGIVPNIAAVASTLYQANCLTQCDRFELPARSAFADLGASRPAFPTPGAPV
jgi:hypothetical protein